MPLMKVFNKEEAELLFNDGKPWEPHNTNNAVPFEERGGYQYIPLKYAVVLGNNETGQVIVIDKRNKSTAYLYDEINGRAMGACFTVWEDFTPARRIEELMSMMISLSTAEGFTAKAVHYGLLDINEYRAMIATDEEHTLSREERQAIKATDPIEIDDDKLSIMDGGKGLY